MRDRSKQCVFKIKNDLICTQQLVYSNVFRSEAAGRYFDLWRGLNTTQKYHSFADYVYKRRQIYQKNSAKNQAFKTLFTSITMINSNKIHKLDILTRASSEFSINQCNHTFEAPSLERNNKHIKRCFSGAAETSRQAKQFDERAASSLLSNSRTLQEIMVIREKLRTSQAQYKIQNQALKEQFRFSQLMHRDSDTLHDESSTSSGTMVRRATDDRERHHGRRRRGGRADLSGTQQGNATATATQRTLSKERRRLCRRRQDCLSQSRYLHRTVTELGNAAATYNYGGNRCKLDPSYQQRTAVPSFRSTGADGMESMYRPRGSNMLNRRAEKIRRDLATFEAEQNNKSPVSPRTIHVGRNTDAHEPARRALVQLGDPIAGDELHTESHMDSEQCRDALEAEIRKLRGQLGGKATTQSFKEIIELDQTKRIIQNEQDPSGSEPTQYHLQSEPKRHKKCASEILFHNAGTCRTEEPDDDIATTNWTSRRQKQAERVEKLERELNLSKTDLLISLCDIMAREVQHLTDLFHKVLEDKAKLADKIAEADWQLQERNRLEISKARADQKREAQKQQEMFDKVMADKVHAENVLRKSLEVQSSRSQEIQTSALNYGNYYYQPRKTMKTDKLIHMLCRTHGVQAAKFANSQRKMEMIREHAFLERRKGRLRHDRWKGRR